MRFAGFVVVFLPLLACKPAPVVLPTGGDGVITIDGTAEAYEVNTALTKVHLVAHSTDAACHSHVVAAESVLFDFGIDDADLAASFVEFNMDVNGLNADRDEYRQAYADDVGDEMLSKVDQGMITNSARGQVGDEDLLFRAHDLSLVVGNGTAQVDATMNGASSSFTANFSSERAADGTITVTLDQTIDTTPHDMPNGFGATCMSADMDLHLVLTLDVVPQEQ